MLLNAQSTAKVISGRLGDDAIVGGKCSMLPYGTGISNFCIQHFGFSDDFCCCLFYMFMYTGVDKLDHEGTKRIPAYASFVCYRTEGQYRKYYFLEMYFMFVSSCVSL